jgi:RNA polymerase sigma factor for flagellar operon FliA
MLQAQALTTEQQNLADEGMDVHQVAALCQANPTLVAEMYAPLIWKVIGRMARRLPPYVQAEDLYGVGALGLMDAVDKFDATKSTGFASYAEYRIRGAILDELRHRDPMPRVLRGRFKEVARKLEALAQALGREPTEPEAARAAGMTLARYQDFRLQVERATTISYNDALAGYYTDGPAASGPNSRVPNANAAFSDDDDDDFEGFEAFRNLLRQEKMSLIAERVSRLEERDQIIMALHYQEGLNFRQIGEVLGLTESRISQIHKAIIQALRSQLQDLE